MTKKRVRYNWNELKLEFFESNFEEVAPFMKQKYSKDTAKNSTIAKNTKWWASEKKNLYRKIENRVIRDFKPNTKSWNTVLSKLEKAHLKWLNLLADNILDSWDDSSSKTISHKEIIDTLNFIKTYKESSQETPQEFWSSLKQRLQELKELQKSK